MLATIIEHGKLKIEYREDGNVHITRQDNMQSIQLSKSEWIYLIRTAELAGWPIAPPQFSVAEMDSTSHNGP